jgi:hypothetical protein
MTRPSDTAEIVTSWQPRPSTVPLESYEFAGRAEHELAFAWAAQFGPQPGMLAVDILPPLPHPLDILFAYATVMPTDQWCDIPLGIPDPRAPWRADAVIGRVRALGGGYLLIQPYRGLGVAGHGWKATLLTVDTSDVDVAVQVGELTLVHAGSRRPVRFGDRLEAERALEPLIHTAGSPPRRWAWDLSVGGMGDIRQWTELPQHPKWPNVQRITRRGRECRWIITASADRIVICRDRAPVQDTAGGICCFADLDEAKLYCEEEDERCLREPY